MLASDCVTLFRNTVSDFGARWSDAAVLNFIDRGNKRIVGDVLFPDSKVIQSTVANKQLYQWPLMLRTDALYVAGELIVPSRIETLEGRGLWTWDASNVNNLPTVGSDAPAGTVGAQAPAWTVTEPVSYPDATGTWCQPAPPTPAVEAQAWNDLQRPRYYWRGGFLGISPPPANSSPVVQMQLDGVRQPDTIVADNQTLTTPDNFMECIVFAGIALAFFNDTSATGTQKQQAAEETYGMHKRRIMRWRGMYEGPLPNLVRPQVLRPMFSRYHKRTAGR